MEYSPWLFIYMYTVFVKGWRWSECVRIIFTVCGVVCLQVRGQSWGSLAWCGSTCHASTNPACPALISSLSHPPRHNICRFWFFLTFLLTPNAPTNILIPFLHAHHWCSGGSQPNPYPSVNSFAYKTWLVLEHKSRANANGIQDFHVKPVSLPSAEKVAGWLSQRRILGSVPA